MGLCAIVFAASKCLDSLHMFLEFLLKSSSCCLYSRLASFMPLIFLQIHSKQSCRAVVVHTRAVLSDGFCQGQREMVRDEDSSWFSLSMIEISVFVYNYSLKKQTNPAPT